MGKVSKVFISYLTVIFFSGFFSDASQAKGKYVVKFNGDTISTDINEVPLKQILEAIKREKGIWFNANKFLLDEKVSVHFNKLTVEKGLRRIFSDFNHALVFNLHQETVGIIILGNKDHGKPLKSDMVFFNKSQNNKNEKNRAKAARVLPFPETGTGSFSRLPENSEGRGLFSPSAESLSERREESFPRSPKESTGKSLFPQRLIFKKP